VTSVIFAKVVVFAQLDIDTMPEKIATERSKQKYLKAKARLTRDRAASQKETASGVPDPNRSTSEYSEHGSLRDMKPWLENLGHIGSVKSAEVTFRIPEESPNFVSCYVPVSSGLIKIVSKLADWSVGSLSRVGIRSIWCLSRGMRRW